MDMSMGIVQPKSKSNYTIFALIVVVAILGFLLLQTSGLLQRNHMVQESRGSVEKKVAVVEEGEKLTAWNIIEMTDWLFWPFVLVTAVGIMLIVYQTLAEHRDRSRALHLLRVSLENTDIQGLIRIIQISGVSRASRLLHQMISTFRKTNQAEPMGDDINQFITTERASFTTFTKVTGFLSESAGALGLLGTVWGIFLTFHAGKMDGPTILRGMSIALVTTLVGLIISLILNIGATYVYTLFNRQLCLLTKRAGELRQVLLYLENHPLQSDTNDVEVKSPQYVW